MNDMIKIFRKVIRKAMPKKASTVVTPEMPRLKWEATQTDLMEFVYSLYLSRKVKDANGRTATINAITTQVFSLFGVDVPKNPTKIVDNLKHRKNPKDISLMYKAVFDLYQDL
jgi:hypothetical protein